MSGNYQFLLVLMVVCAFVVHNSFSIPISMEQAKLEVQDGGKAEPEELKYDPATPNEQESEEGEISQSQTFERKKQKPVGNGNTLVIYTPAGPQGTQVSTPVGPGTVQNPESTSNSGIPGIDQIQDQNPNPNQGGTDAIDPAVQLPLPTYP